MKHFIATLREDQIPEFIKILKKQNGLSDDIGEPVSFFKKRIRADDSFYTAVYVSQHKEPIGYMAIDPIMADSAVISFLLTPGIRIQKAVYLGVAKSFMAMVINTYSLKKLYLTVTENFKPAIRIAGLLGFKKTRYFGHTKRNEEEKKMLIFSIRKGEVL